VSKLRQCRIVLLLHKLWQINTFQKSLKSRQWRRMVQLSRQTIPRLYNSITEKVYIRRHEYTQEIAKTHEIWSFSLTFALASNNVYCAAAYMRDWWLHNMLMVCEMFCLCYRLSKCDHYTMALMMDVCSSGQHLQHIDCSQWPRPCCKKVSPISGSTSRAKASLSTSSSTLSRFIS